jgi:hypothetical protein
MMRWDMGVRIVDGTPRTFPASPFHCMLSSSHLTERPFEPAQASFPVSGKGHSYHENNLFFTLVLPSTFSMQSFSTCCKASVPLFVHAVVRPSDLKMKALAKSTHSDVLYWSRGRLGGWQLVRLVSQPTRRER